MKKIICAILIVGILLSIAIYSSGCQSFVRNYGGDMTIELPENTKLEMITWKESSLWLLTRPMTAEDKAEVHTFEESSNYGVLEGTITIIETKGD